MNPRSRPATEHGPSAVPAGSAGQARDPGWRGRLSLYLLGAVLVRLVDEGSRVALVLLALQRTGSAGVGGLLIGALLLPHVVAAPVVGLLVDRVRRPRLVLAGGSAGFSVALAATAALLGSAPVALVVLVLLAGGCCGPALTGGLTSRLSDLVPAERMPRAFGLDSLSYNVSGVVGPALAGVLAVVIGPGAATLALAVVAAVGAVALGALPLRSTGGEVSTAESVSLTSGARAIVTDRVLALVTAASSVGQLGFGALPVFAAVLAGRLHAAADTGLLLTAVAAGAFLGSTAWTLRPLAAPRAPLTVMITLVGAGLPIAAVSAAPSIWIATALFAISGLFTGPYAGALFLTRGDRAPDAIRGQVFTIGAGLKTTAAAAGAALGGVVADLSTPAQFVLAAGCPVVAGLVGAILLPRHAQAGASRG